MGAMNWRRSFVQECRQNIYNHSRNLLATLVPHSWWWSSTMAVRWDQSNCTLGEEQCISRNTTRAQAQAKTLWQRCAQPEPKCVWCGVFWFCAGVGVYMCTCMCVCRLRAICKPLIGWRRPCARYAILVWLLSCVIANWLGYMSWKLQINLLI